MGPSTAIEGESQVPKLQASGCIRQVCRVRGATGTGITSGSRSGCALRPWGISGNKMAQILYYSDLGYKTSPMLVLDLFYAALSQTASKL